MRNILVTGGAGFIGRIFVKYMLGKYAGYRVVNVDVLTYAGNLENLRAVAEKTPIMYLLERILGTGKRLIRYFLPMRLIWWST